VEELTGDLPEARRQLGRAARKSPEDWTTHLLLARVETKLGDLAAARRSLARARKLNPHALSFPPPPAQ
jgi:Flp pilus assembly protein TadD